MANLPHPARRSSTPAFSDKNGSLFGLWREMDRLFDDLTRSARAPGAHAKSEFAHPAVDVSESVKGFEVRAELPGVEEKNINVEYNDGTLSLRAERSFEKEDKDEKKRYHLMERSHGTFLRRFRLPFEADPDKVEASFSNGVLRIFVPRPQSAKPHTKKIELMQRH